MAVDGEFEFAGAPDGEFRELGAEGRIETGVAGTETGVAAGNEFRRRTLKFGLGVLLVVIGLTALGGFTYRTPYVALVPGSARDTEPLVEIDGAEEFPSDGELLFTTVRLKGNPNLWEYLWLRGDDDAEIVDEEIIYGDRTADENREVNLQAMTDSKQTAVAVALEQLGYDVITPTGVFVAEVVPDTAAADVLFRGDVILQIDGSDILVDQDLIDALSDTEPGDQISVLVERFGTTDTETLELELGPRPDDQGGGFLGVAPQTRVDIVDELPFDVEIDSGSVGGPSAGLAFTLAILDQLTEGELTGGIDVAVTGTIGPGGFVGSVGGVPQKAAAVRDLGVEVFIVPAALGDEAIAQVRDIAGDGVDVRPVSTLEEALAVLESLGGETAAIEEFAAGNL